MKSSDPGHSGKLVLFGGVYHDIEGLAYFVKLFNVDVLFPKLFSIILGDDVDVKIYRRLLASAPAEDEAILLRDIDRTMPHLELFKEGASGRKMLQNILIAYSKWDPEVGYVQGMNYIVAYLLIHMPEEKVIN